jgi:hypothetical protein
MKSTLSACVAASRPSRASPHTPQVRHSSAFKGYGSDPAGFWQVQMFGADSCDKCSPRPAQVYTRVFERIDALEELAEASNV